MGRAQLKSKRSGDWFENVIKFHASKQGMACEKIPSGAKWVGPNRTIAVRTPFDFILAFDGKCAVFDAKLINADRFPKSQIKPHQLKSLCAFGAVGISSGYVINFVKTNRVEFFSWEKLAALKTRDSLKSGDGLLLGDQQRFDLSLIFI